MPASTLAARIERLEGCFLLVDAARDPGLLEMVKDTNAPYRYRSLFDGRRAENIAAVAPYLLDPSSTPQVIRRLLERALGQSSMVLIESRASFDVVRRHLRSLLLVENEEGQVLYFRFWDPRVLRRAMAAATPDERTRLFGAADALWVEAQGGREFFCFRREDVFDPDAPPPRDPLVLRDEHLEAMLGEEPDSLLG